MEERSETMAKERDPTPLGTDRSGRRRQGKLLCFNILTSTEGVFFLTLPHLDKYSVKKM